MAPRGSAPRTPIDLVPVDERHQSAKPSWRTLLATEPVSAFVGFGRPVSAPIAGTVVATHDDEPDHDASRSPVAYLFFALGQASRIRAGIAAVAGTTSSSRWRQAGRTS